MSVGGHSAGHGFNDFVAGVPRLVRQSFARPEQICRGRKGRRFDVIKGFCRVAAQWPDLIWATDGQAPMTPYKEFISGRAKPFPAPTGHFIKVDGRFIKATKANGHVIKANGRFIKANGRFIKADGRLSRGALTRFKARLGSGT